MESKKEVTVGAQFMCDQKGKQRHVQVCAWLPNSRTMVEVVDVDRGKGWDNDEQQYVGVRTSSGWERGQNYGYGQKFWFDEYRMNAAISEYSKPIVSFLQGFTMGGGVGVGCHASHRIVGESIQSAMPECGCQATIASTSPEARTCAA